MHQNLQPQTERVVPLRQLAERIGIDKATAFAVAGNIASFVIGPVTALVVAARLSPELQGFYYTFGSLSILQLLAEFGLGQALIQFASHQWSRLRMGALGELSGDPECIAYLAGLARTAFVWCSVLAVVLLLSLIGAGEWLFAPNHRVVAWRGPWFLVVGGLVANLFLTPLWALLQGCHETASFWFYRLVQQVLRGATLWLALMSGGGLWSLGISSAVGLCWSCWFVYGRYRRFVGVLAREPPAAIKWRRDLWPLQWRTAITWMSSNFTSYLFTPILFRVAGPAEAGQMGMTVTLATVLTALASNMVVTRGPAFGTLIAERRFEDLDRLFRRQMIATAVIAVAGSVAIVLAIAVLKMSGHPLGGRVLALPGASMLMGYATITALLIGAGTYLRAHKVDPLAPLSVVAVSATLVLGSLMAKRAGATGLAAAAVLVAVAVQLPWAAWLVAKQRRTNAGALPRAFGEGDA